MHPFAGPKEVIMKVVDHPSPHQLLFRAEVMLCLLNTKCGWAQFLHKRLAKGSHLN